VIFIGIDLGQSQDYTAIAVVEHKNDAFHLRHIERLPLDTPYTSVVKRIEALVDSIPACQIVLDATGVGRPVLDSLRAAGIEPLAVSITAGRKSRYENGMYYLPKRELVRALITALENGKLQIASGLPLANVFLDEVSDFKRTVSAKGYVSYEAANGHDDLVIAAALAVWGVGAII
jgi:hypothetical protein